MFGQYGIDRVYGLIEKHKRSGVIILSGDVHFTQYYTSMCKSQFGYPLTEITSSGLSHHLDETTPDLAYGTTFITNRRQMTSEAVSVLNFGGLQI
jgi:hypothetical protein